MANRVLIKRSAVQGKVPTTSDLQLGELGLNTYDGKLYTKKDTGTPTIVEIGASVAWGGITGTLSNQTDLDTALNGKAASSHQHAGGDITSGTVAAARLGSGTPSATNYLRGDSTWGTNTTKGTGATPPAGVDGDVYYQYTP